MADWGVQGREPRRLGAVLLCLGLLAGIFIVNAGPSQAAPASHLGVIVSDDQITAGDHVGVTIVARDDNNATDTGFRGTVHFTSSDPNASLPVDFTFTAADNGQRSFPSEITLRTPGTQTVKVNDVAAPSIKGGSGSTHVLANTPVGFSVGLSGTTTAGQAGTVSVQAIDRNGRTAPTYIGTVHFTSSDPAATLPSDYTFTAADNGFHSFSNAVTLRTPTAQTVSATDTGNANLRGDAFPSLVIGNGATHFDVFISDGITVGETRGFSIRALDNSNVTDASYRGTVHFTTTDANAVVPADYTFTATDNGFHSFPAASGVKFQTAGTQSIRAADTSKPNLRGDGNPVSVSPAVTTTLTVTSTSTSVTAGQASSFQVNAVNDNGIVQTGYRGTVHFTSTDPGATLPADYTFIAADNGRHFFSSGVTYNSPGAQRISVADTTTPTLRADSGQTLVYATVAKFLNVSVFDSDLTSGRPAGLQVTAVNEGNVTVAGYRGTIHFTSSDPSATLPADYTFAAADNGNHFFSTGVTYVTAGSQRVSAVDTSNASLRGDSNPSRVYPDTAKQIAVDVVDDGDTGTVGKQYDVQIRILNENQFSDAVAGYRGTIHFTSTDPSATLPADYTFTEADAGQHTFEDALRFGTIGVQRVSANDIANTDLRGDATQTFVYPAAATYLGFSLPFSTTAGTANTITVTAQNLDDQIDTGYRGTVQFSSSDTAAGLPANYTFTAADNGQKAFTVTWNTAGTQSLRVQDTAAALVRGEANTRVGAGTGLRMSVFGGGTAGNKSTVNMAQSVQLQALTTTGSTDTGYRGTVHFTSTDPNAVLPADYTFTAADNGFHTFSGALTIKTTGVQVVQASEGSRFASNAQVMVGNAVTHFNLRVSSPVTTGASTGVSVEAVNDIGVELPYTGTVHFTSTDAGATVPPDYTFIASDGGFHFTSMTFAATSTTRTLSVNDRNQTSLKGLSGAVYLYPIPATYFGVSVSNTNFSVGQQSSVFVTALNNLNDRDEGYRGTVHFSSTDQAAGLPADYAFTAADNGSHSFNFTPAADGGRSITVTDTAQASRRGHTQSFHVYPATATFFSIDPATTTVSVGQPQTITVRARNTGNIVDTGYRGTIHFTSTDPAATLPTDYTFVAADAGVHQFTVTPNTDGVRAVTATDTTAANVRGHSPAFRVYPAAATHFRVDFFVSSITTGRALDVRVQALNNGNVIDKNYRGTIHFTSTDPGAQVPADYTFTAGDAGQRTFTNGVTFATGGGRSASVNDTTATTIRGDSGSILAIFDGATRLQISVFNGSGTQGRKFDASVQALNDRGDVDPSYRGTIHFASSDPAATVPSDYTFTAADAGAKTFTALTTFNTPGYRNLSARDTSTTLTIQGFSGSVSIVPSAATRLRLGPGSSVVNPGEASSLTVTAVNDRGDKDDAYRGTVHFTSTDSAATMPADYTFTAGDAGAKTLVSAASFTTPGGQSILGTDTVNGVLRGYSTDILVRNGPAPTTTTTSGSSTTTTVPGTTTTTPAGSAVRLEVIMPLGDATAGQPRDITVTARDSQGRIATSYAGTVHFTSTDPGAVLPANYTFVTADAGTHAFPGGVRFATPGNQRVTATDTANATVTGDGPTILVFDPNASHFTVAFNASSATSGDPLGVTVSALNDRNDVDTGYRGTVHFTSTDSAAVLPADYTFVAGDAGHHTFADGVTFKTAGNQRLAAADTTHPTVNGTSAAVIVHPAAASRFDVDAPATANAGEAVAIEVIARDGSANVVTGHTGTVHFTSTDTAATLPADYAFVAGDAGRHTFSVVLQTGGNQTVTVTDAASTSINGTSRQVDVNPTVPSSTTSSTSTTTTTVPESTTTTIGETTTTVPPCSPPAVNVSPSSLNAGDQATVTGCGFGPNQTLNLEFHSDPVALGSTLSDASGNYSMLVTIPFDAPAGNHNIVVIGPDAQSLSTQGQGAVFVQGPPTNTPPPTVATSGSGTSGVASGTAGSGSSTGGSSTGGSAFGGSSSGGATSSGGSAGGSGGLSSALGGLGSTGGGAATGGTGATNGAGATTGSGATGGSASQSAQGGGTGTTTDSGRASRDSGTIKVPGPDNVALFGHVDKSEGDRTAAVRAAQKGDRSVLSKAVRNIGDVNTDLKTIAVNVLLAAGLILLIGFPSDLFNSTLFENYDEIKSWFRWGHKPFSGFENSFDSLPTSIRLLVYGFIGSLLYGFLDPKFGFNRSSAILILGLLGALATISFVLDHLRSVYIGRAIGTNGRLKAFPIGLVVAAILVFASRMAHFQPGYVFGVFTGLAFEEELGDEDDGRALAIGSIGVLAVAVIALLLRTAIDDAASKADAGFWLLVLDGALATLWLVGVQAIVWGLMPLRFLYGASVKAWSFWGWLAIWGTGVFLFVHTLLQPQLGLYGSADRTSFFSVAVLFLAFGGFSLAFWAYFRYRGPRPGSPAPQLDRSDVYADLVAAEGSRSDS